jgi:D-alanyl-D-alanine carboxypeptidase
MLISISSLIGLVALALVAIAPAERPHDQERLILLLTQDEAGIPRDSSGRPLAIFDVPLQEARIVFLPVTRERALPAGYEPTDLDRSTGRPVRALVVPDLRALIDAAAADGVEIAVVSGYRSPEQQAEAFEASYWRQLARGQGAIDEHEARTRASRFVAPPGHSQHQLGTAVDLSTWELSYAVQPRFAETAAGRWVVQNGWRFGFVLPYTVRGEARTGYAFEPWHVRWVGRPLAALMHTDGYLDHPTLVSDDYLTALEVILNAEAVP